MIRFSKVTHNLHIYFFNKSYCLGELGIFIRYVTESSFVGPISEAGSFRFRFGVAIIHRNKPGCLLGHGEVDKNAGLEKNLL